MCVMTIRLPDATHERLRAFARARGVSLNEVMEDLATRALTEHDLEARFRARAARRESRRRRPGSLEPSRRTRAQARHTAFETTRRDLCRTQLAYPPDVASGSARLCRKQRSSGLSFDYRVGARLRGTRLRFLARPKQTDVPAQLYGGRQDRKQRRCREQYWA